MAQSTETDSGTIFTPGAYADYKVVSSPSSLATSGVLVFMGEANQGPDFSVETDLGKNVFGPSSESDVVAKYGSGHLVANDPDIKGTFTGAIFVKTNVSGKATGPLLDWSAANYATIQDRSFGKPGNLISYKVTAKTAEVAPTTGPFTLLQPNLATQIAVAANGAGATTLTFGSQDSIPNIVTAIGGVSGVSATGGANRGIIAGVAGALTLTVVSGNLVTFTYSINYGGTLPSPGDTLVVPSFSVLTSGHSNNAGSYVVTGSTLTVISATKLLDGQGTGAHNACTPPSTIGPTNVASTSNDLQAFSPVTIQSVTANPIPGTGKSLEIALLVSDPGLLSDIAYTYSSGGGAVPATFWSTSTTPKILVSGAEYVADLTEARQMDHVTNDLVAGGKVALALGYQGATASAVNDGTHLTITVTGGSGTSPAAIALKDFATIADLAGYISSLTGFTAAPGTAVMGSQPPTSLDVGTYTFASTWGGTPGRIKQDAYAFFNMVNANAVLVQIAAKAPTGLPAPSAIAFLAGGTLGGTTDAAIQAATSALRLVRANFVIPLFSRDATADIADGLTDTSSTYTIAGIHSYVRAHVLQMSNMKAKRHRQAFLSIRDTFANAVATASNLASSRCSCAFEDVMDADGSIGVEQYQPWMAAVKAAAMQAGAFYQAIFAKGIAISGAVQAAGDFKDQDPDQVDQALQAGLLPIVRDETGLYIFSSDQTTYGADNNFVFNSIQAMYAADLVTLTLAQRMQKAFVGKSLADVTASLASTTVSSIMADLMRLKLIAPSDDAPKGYKNVSVKIKGPVMAVKMAVKLSTSIYFVVINFTVEQVQQSA